MRPLPLPHGTPVAFTVSAARSRGISEKRLRAKDLERPFHGTRSSRELTDRQRLRLLLEALPDHAFACGSSAALVWDLPLSTGAEDDARSRPHIGVPRNATRIRRAGVVGHRLDVEDRDVVVEKGIRSLSPSRLWIDVSPVLALPRLLALTDALLSARHPLATIDELAAAHGRFAGRRGAQVRTRVLELADGRSESPRESMVRLILVEAGLPAPECNVEIHDGNRFVARVDMLYRLRRLIIEYDGDHHRDPDQWSRDQIRRAELEALGYRVTVVTRRDFDDPAALVRRIRRLLAA
jgi:hypothetical protein